MELLRRVDLRQLDTYHVPLLLDPVSHLIFLPLDPSKVGSPAAAMINVGPRDEGKQPR